jgi:hypothetical protein
MCKVGAQNLDGARTLSRAPAHQWQRPHDLEADLPLVTLGEFADKHPFVRVNPVRVFVCELLEHVERSRRDQPVFILSQRREFVNAF